ncbi:MULTISPECIES: DUF2800 domain-containing protein [unclassified Mesorhizobium]|uniref:DUF2800 domain-containing protein n=1 Tax=unclassified Mesorhizobium TaxID=325217 RepID=UPI000FD7B6BA|nr:MULTISPECIES: DUF2800 domain-containing protein [unclassified Mesorhizobium]TGT76193.1 DUF2800 domain-containing protein [Mesorhizobium sp. M2E.F.Ca.ET.166.01.1.1]TGW02308.1 DUF2800 domain-containing protein [Mesorhizobium sp. M2E.F.Ca.ET.154.01.1.1]
MADHGARDHATWSASATARNVHCPGALTLAQFAPPQRESLHSARGTACHQIAEKCLRTGVDASSFLGEIEKTKEREIEIDEELVNSAQEYVDYCRFLTPDSQWWVEERFDLSALGTPFDAGGTGDFVSYSAIDRSLEIVDLKNGMGVVDVNENPQLRTYGLGALLAHPDLDVERVTVTIVQPRAPHKDGRIRSETFHIADLIDWTADLLKAMQRSKQAMDEHAAAKGNTVLLDEWRDKWLKPGKCTFCPVEGSCPALKRDALSVAAVWFDDMDQPRLGNAALDTDPASLNRDLNMIPMLEDWIKARRALAHSMAEQGVEFEDHMLVDKIGNRKWADEIEAVTALMEAGLAEDNVYTRKPVSPAQAEKLLGSKRKALIEPFVVREVTGTNLVSRAKTTRSAAKSKAETYFEAQP